MLVYLAGPMTGVEDFNRAEFERQANRLRSAGHEVHSPIERDLEVYGSWEAAVSRPWQEHLARDIAEVPTCDAIALMDGWEASTGANLELHIARVFKLAVFDVVDGPLNVRALRLWEPRDFDEVDGVVRGDIYHAPSQYKTAYSRRAAIDRQFDLAEAMADGDNSDLSVSLSSDALLGDAKFETYESNPLRQIQETGGVKDNRGKPRVDLIPTEPLLGVGRVLAFGARKYKPNNWRLGLRYSDTIASAMRHILAFNDGEDMDHESGEMHVDNAICQLLFLSEYWHKKTGIDDRWQGVMAEAHVDDEKAG